MASNSTIDVDALLRDLSPDAPCGEDLSADPAYSELERLVQGTPERQVGETIVPAVEPDWKLVVRRCNELSARTKDLRVCVYHTLALLKLHGPPGLRDGLAVARGLVERHWENVYPRLDPDDDNDPMERLNILGALTTPPGSYGDTIMLEQRLRESPLANSRRLGRFGLRDVAIAKGDAKPADPSKPKAELTVIEAALDDTPAEELRSTDAAAAEAIGHVKALSAALDERVGSGHSLDVTRLAATLNEVRAQLKRPLARHGGSAVPATPSPTPTASTSPATATASQDDSAASAGPMEGPAGGSAMTQQPPSEVRSKQDVILALQRVCDYYERHEPSSPIPLLLKGAQRLVSANFMEIMKLLPPETLTHITQLSGQGEE